MIEAIVLGLAVLVLLLLIFYFIGLYFTRCYDEIFSSIVMGFIVVLVILLILSIAYTLGTILLEIIK